jgi:hypothetical protein
MLHISIPIYIFLQFNLCYVLYMQSNGWLDRTQQLHTHSLEICYVSVQFEDTTFDHKYMINCSELIEVSNTIYIYIYVYLACITVCITTEYMHAILSEWIYTMYIVYITPGYVQCTLYISHNPG